MSKAEHHPLPLYLTLSTGSLAPLAVLLGLRAAGDRIEASTLSCALIILTGLAIASICAYEISNTASRIKAIICPSIFQDNTGFLAGICRSHIGVIITAAITGLAISVSLLIFISTVPIAFFGLLAAASLTFAVLRIRFSTTFATLFKSHAATISRRLTLTALLTFFLMGAYFLILMTLPSTGLRPGTPDIPQEIMATVHHGCHIFQDLIRTSHFIDLTIRSLSEYEEIGGAVYLALIASFMSAVPIIGYIVLTRFSYERTRLLVTGSPAGKSGA